MNATTILRLAVDLAFEQGREHERGWHAIARVTELKRRDVLRQLEVELGVNDDKGTDN